MEQVVVRPQVRYRIAERLKITPDRLLIRPATSSSWQHSRQCARRPCVYWHRLVWAWLDEWRWFQAINHDWSADRPCHPNYSNIHQHLADVEIRRQRPPSRRTFVQITTNLIIMISIEMQHTSPPLDTHDNHLLTKFTLIVTQHQLFIRKSRNQL